MTFEQACVVLTRGKIDRVQYKVAAQTICDSPSPYTFATALAWLTANQPKGALVLGASEPFDPAPMPQPWQYIQASYVVATACGLNWQEIPETGWKGDETPDQIKADWVATFG